MLQGMCSFQLLSEHPFHLPGVFRAGGLSSKQNPAACGGHTPFTAAIPPFLWSSQNQAQQSTALHLTLLECFVCAFKAAAFALELWARSAFRNLSQFVFC